MDAEILARLETLPDDLERLGWWLDPEHTRGAPPQGATPARYQVTYRRPFEPDIDDPTAATVIAGPLVMVEVQSQTSWDDAYGQAIEAMRQVDAKRTP